MCGEKAKPNLCVRNSYTPTRGHKNYNYPNRSTKFVLNKGVNGIDSLYCPTNFVARFETMKFVGTKSL